LSSGRFSSLSEADIARGRSATCVCGEASATADSQPAAWMSRQLQGLGARRAQHKQHDNIHKRWSLTWRVTALGAACAASKHPRATDCVSANGHARGMQQVRPQQGGWPSPVLSVWPVMLWLRLPDSCREKLVAISLLYLVCGVWIDEGAAVVCSCSVWAGKQLNA
jgi:hypothetical protein